MLSLVLGEVGRVRFLNESISSLTGPFHSSLTDPFHTLRLCSRETALIRHHCPPDVHSDGRGVCFGCLYPTFYQISGTLGLFVDTRVFRRTQLKLNC